MSKRSPFMYLISYPLKYASCSNLPTAIILTINLWSSCYGVIAKGYLGIIGLPSHLIWLIYLTTALYPEPPWPNIANSLNDFQSEIRLSSIDTYSNFPQPTFCVISLIWFLLKINFVKLGKCLKSWSSSKLSIPFYSIFNILRLGHSSFFTVYSLLIIEQLFRAKKRTSIYLNTGDKISIWPQSKPMSIRINSFKR